MPSMGRKSDPREMTYYELLEVSPEASADEIRAAVPAVRRKWSGRQSRVGEPGERARAAMARIAEAESILLDPARRAAYDESLRPRPEAAAAVTRDGDRDWLAEARRYLDQGKLDLAEGALDHAMVRGRGKADTWLVAHDIYRSRAFAESVGSHQRENCQKRAKKALREALLLEPEYYRCYEVKGDSLLWPTVYPDDALEAYREAERLVARTGDPDAVARVFEKRVYSEAKAECENGYKRLNYTMEHMPARSAEDEIKDDFRQVDRDIADFETRLEGLYAQVSNPSQWFMAGVEENRERCQRLEAKSKNTLDEKLRSLAMRRNQRLAEERIRVEQQKAAEETARQEQERARREGQYKARFKSAMTLLKLVIAASFIAVFSTSLYFGVVYDVNRGYAAAFYVGIVCYIAILLLNRRTKKIEEAYREELHPDSSFQCLPCFEKGSIGCMVPVGYVCVYVLSWIIVALSSL